MVFSQHRLSILLHVFNDFTALVCTYLLFMLDEMILLHTFAFTLLLRDFESKSVKSLQNDSFYQVMSTYLTRLSIHV